MIRDRWCRSQSLVESLVAAAVLVCVLLALSMSLSRSMVVIRDSPGRVVAQRAAEALAESLQSRPYSEVYDEVWGPKGISTYQNPEDSRLWVTGGDARGLLAEVVDDVLEPAQDLGTLSPPRTGPDIAIRLLSEADYGQMLGVPMDLDSSGTPGEALPPPGTGSSAPGYDYCPLLIEVRWRDDLGDQRLVLLTVVSSEPPLDPARH